MKRILAGRRGQLARWDLAGRRWGVKGGGGGEGAEGAVKEGRPCRWGGRWRDLRAAAQGAARAPLSLPLDLTSWRLRPLAPDVRLSHPTTQQAHFSPTKAPMSQEARAGTVPEGAQPRSGTTPSTPSREEDKEQLQEQNGLPNSIVKAVELGWEKEEPLRPEERPYGASGLDVRNMSCVSYFDRIWWCYTPGNQMKAYYRTGGVDPCSHKVGDLKTCMALTAKAFSSPKEAQEELERSSLNLNRRPRTSLTAGVWQLRERPSMKGDRVDE